MKSVILKTVSSLGLMLGLNVATALAVPITGAIGFVGPYTSNLDDLTMATTLSFSNAGVNQVRTSGASTGSFSGIPSLTPVTMFTPLMVNQPGVTLPAGPIWSVGGFTLTLTSLFEAPGNTATQLGLSGVGILSDGPGGLDDTMGDWNATFNRAGTGVNANFTFSASSSALPSVPDGGSSAVLLGLALVGLGCFARRSIKS